MPVRISKNRVALENIPLNEAAEVSIASAATTDIGAAASNNVLITGTATITGLGTAAAGITRKGRFAGALTLTHNATSLILPGAANIVTAANHTFEAMSLGSGNWIVTKYQKADGTAVAGSAVAGQVIQVQKGTDYTTYASAAAAAAFPLDDSIPQNTEGVEIINDCTITPGSATNRLRIHALIPALTAGSIPFDLSAAIFQDSTANALRTGCAVSNPTGSFGLAMIYFTHEMAAGTTSPTTFKLRWSPCSAGTSYINGNSSARRYGGSMGAQLWVEEIKV